MNREDRQQLKVRLFLEGGTDFLEFDLGRSTHRLNLNLEDNQNEIKQMFCDVVPILEANAVEFVLEVDKSYDNTLLREVSSSYISDLNKDIDEVRTEILDKEQADE